MHYKQLISVVTCVGLFLYAGSGTVSAHHKKAVLGETVAASDVTVPPVTAGPGIFLPDNPLYFLDKTVQSIKLSLAFSPEKKAEVHETVAQERLAELRVMMAKNNVQGIQRALSELSKENSAVAKELKLASARGKNVKDLAGKLNESLKRQREFLDVISEQSKGSLKLQLKAAKEELKNAKLEVEDQLSEEDIENELEEDLADEIDENIHEASESAKGLEHSIDVLTKLASEAAEKDQQKREEALRRAIENKNETLKRKEEKLLQLEKKKQEKLMQLNKEAAETAREAVKKAEETAKKLDEAKKLQNETKQTEQNKSESSENSNSGSGSSSDDD